MGDSYTINQEFGLLLRLKGIKKSHGKFIKAVTQKLQQYSTKTGERIEDKVEEIEPAHYIFNLGGKSYAPPTMEEYEEANDKDYLFLNDYNQDFEGLAFGIHKIVGRKFSVFLQDDFLFIAVKRISVTGLEDSYSRVSVTLGFTLKEANKHKAIVDQAKTKLEDVGLKPSEPIIHPILQIS